MKKKHDETFALLDRTARLPSRPALLLPARLCSHQPEEATDAALKKNKFSQAGVIEKVLRMVEAKDTAKALYKEYDQLLKELVPQLKVNQPIDLGNGETAMLIDNFEDSNKAWKPCGINRFDIETTRAKSLAKPKPEANGPELAAASSTS